MLQNSEIKKLILKLWNIFWSGGISNPLTAIEQITYLIFIKRLDILDDEKKVNDEKYISIFSGKYKKIVKIKNKEMGEDEEQEQEFPKTDFRWHNILQIVNKEERLEHIRKYVFPFIKNLRAENSHFTKHMENAVFIIPSESLLYEAMDIIEEIYIEIEKQRDVENQIHQDIQGDVYEHLINEIATSGKNGQFRTPRHIINLLVELVDPKEKNKIVDPACGSAGFLLGAYQYILTTLDEDKKNIPSDEDGFKRTNQIKLSDEQIKGFEENLRGFDIDLTMVR
jgi:type I restriction enzyme M protein